MSFATISMAVLMSFALTACNRGGDVDEPAAQQAEEDSSSVLRERRTRAQTAAPPPPPTRQADPSVRIPRVQGQTSGESFGLTLVIDGSSPAAFAESLELIASDTSAEQYRQLDSALRYLQVYSPDGWQGLPEFYSRLNGMTGEEIIERANRFSAERRGR
jgi:hypothetical protein